MLALAAAFLVSIPAPAPATGPSSRVSDASLPSAARPTAFTDCSTGTGLSATVLIPAEAAIRLPAGGIVPGDQVAIVAEGGACAGVGTWTDSGLAMSVWADDPFTEDVEGLAAGAPLAFRVWSAATGETQEPLEVGFEQGFGDADGFSIDALYIVAEATPVAADAPADGPALQALAQSRPNPTRGLTTIAFTLSRPEAVALDVFDSLGRLVATPLSGERTAGEHSVTLDTTGFAAGMYVYRLRAGSDMLQKRLTVSR